MAASTELRSQQARLNTFHLPYQLSKRRASSQTGRKKGANTVEWPHQRPRPGDLARAGFYYKPAPDSIDNVQCFFCDIKLDGWEEDDDPIEEHLAHRSTCQWAQCLGAAHNAQRGQGADPMDDVLVAARRATYEQAGAVWPHETKRGWKCKIGRMADAGFCFDPTSSAVEEDEEGDGAVCFYCDLSLNGWEPKDDPSAEHLRRRPDCIFFALVSSFAPAKGAKPSKSKSKAKADRTSAMSKASRMSTQSAFSMFSEPPSLSDEGTILELPAETDSSIVAAATTTATAKGGKKAAKTKAPAKGRKRAATVTSETDSQVLYPDLSQSQALLESQTSQEALMSSTEPAPKRGRKAARSSKQVDSSVLDSSTIDGPSLVKKATRGRKAKETVVAQPPTEIDQSQVSTQLQEELDRSLSIDLEARFERDDRTPQPSQQQTQPKRGTKRTSEGAPKPLPELPIEQAAAKPKKTKGTSKHQAVASTGVIGSDATASEQLLDQDAGELETGAEELPKMPKKRQSAAPKKGTKGRKVSTVKRASQSTKPTPMASEAVQMFADPDEEDLARDEEEIEAELARIAAEEDRAIGQQVIETETDKIEEFEQSPTSHEKRSARALKHMNVHVSNIQALEQELQAEVDDLPAPGKNMATYVEAVARPSWPQLPPTSRDLSLSPSGSDKENAPASTAKAAIETIRSPSKTVRVALAPGTPNRAPPSPTKHLSRQTSTVPWEAIDLDAILLASPTQPLTPGSLAARLAGAAGALASPEKGLTVEQWVRAQADKGEADLRRRCEEMVVRFEREGNRAMASLGGMTVL